MPDDLESAVLFDWQRHFLGIYSRSELALRTYLSGGTALAAFYLEHRDSEDLDFFGQEETPLTAINALLDEVGARERRYTKLYDRKIFLFAIDGHPAKTEFTRFPFPSLRSPHRLASGVSIDDLHDIYANKLHAMVEREEGKDDVDVYFLLQQPDLPPLAEMVELSQNKFGVAGLTYSLQRRLLRVPATLPPTRPPVDRETVRVAFRRQAEELARLSL